MKLINDHPGLPLLQAAAKMIPHCNSDLQQEAVLLAIRIVAVRPCPSRV